jgi:uncharacterized protein YoxC
LDFIYLAAALLVVAALAFIFFAVRFHAISPQMGGLQTTLQKSQADNTRLCTELQKTRAENLKLQEELQKTRVSLDSCTTALNDQ